MVLDETIGNPSITLNKNNRKQWKYFWATLGQMSRLKVLYFNVDTLYPNIWTAELERELLRPLIELRHVPEMYIFVRWVKPIYKDSNPNWFEDEIGKPLIRGDSDDVSVKLFRQSPAGDMRRWIIQKVRALERGDM